MKPALTIEDILDGWFGEPLEHAEDEEHRRRCLYDPLHKLVSDARLEGACLIMAHVVYDYRIVHVHYRERHDLAARLGADSADGWNVVSICDSDTYTTVYQSKKRV